MIQSTGDTRYAYVNGIIRAREARLLTKSHFERLIAVDENSFGAILSDTAYAGARDFGESLTIEENVVRAFFDRSCVTPEVRSLVEWPEQIHNLKVKLKQGGKELLYGSSSEEVESWPDVVDAVAAYALEKDPFVLSTALDRALCRHLYEAALFGEFFRGYYELYFDLENIRSFFRVKQFDDRREILKSVYIPAGRLSLDLLVDCLDLAHDQLVRNLFNTPYAAIVDRGGVYYEKNNSFLRLERLCEERRLGYLAQARWMAFGVEPLFGYYMFKNSEITKLRQVYWGKLNEVPVENLKESIPDVW